MTLFDMINRLIQKRAIYFLGPKGKYQIAVVNNGKYELHSGSGGWENVGTSLEFGHLKFSNVLTYEEMRLSSLMGFSSHSVLINNGNRHNEGRYEENRAKLQDNAVVIGLVSARLEKANFMEYRDMVRTPEVIYDNALDNIFRDYYTTRGCQRTSSMLNFSHERKLDTCVFKQRTKIIIKPLLIEANARVVALEAQENKKAYIHLIGLGLGVWKKHAKQSDVFVTAVIEAIEELAVQIPHVGYIRFDHFANKESLDLTAVKHVKISFKDEDPHVKVGKEYLLFEVFAYNGNSLPGNSYWIHEEGSLSRSGDPAAACSTQIAEIQNPLINPRMSASNLMIATNEGKLVRFVSYKFVNL